MAVDYATYCAAEVAREAALFLVDERGQFLANRDAGLFDDYPDPTATLGEALLAGTPRPAEGRVVVTHLGVGLADVVFGAAIVRRAEALGLGTLAAVLTGCQAPRPRSWWSRDANGERTGTSGKSVAVSVVGEIQSTSSRLTMIVDTSRATIEPATS